MLTGTYIIFIEPADPKAYDTLQYKIAMMVCGVSDWIQQVVNVTNVHNSLSIAHMFVNLHLWTERDIPVVYYWFNRYTASVEIDVFADSDIYSCVT